MTFYIRGCKGVNLEKIGRFDLICKNIFGQKIVKNPLKEINA